MPRLDSKPQLLTHINTARLGAGIQPLLQGEMDENSQIYLNLVVALLSSLQTGKKDPHLDGAAEEYETKVRLPSLTIVEAEGSEANEEGENGNENQISGPISPYLAPGAGAGATADVPGTVSAEESNDGTNEIGNVNLSRLSSAVSPSATNNDMQPTMSNHSGEDKSLGFDLAPFIRSARILKRIQSIL